MAYARRFRIYDASVQPPPGVFGTSSILLHNSQENGALLVFRGRSGKVNAIDSECPGRELA